MELYENEIEIRAAVRRAAGASLVENKRLLAYQAIKISSNIYREIGIVRSLVIFKQQKRCAASRISLA